MTSISNSKLLRSLLTCIVALAGGGLFALIHMPIPWLLGPMTAVLIASNWGKLPLYWPGAARDAGIIIVGYSTGLSLTKAAFAEIFHQLPSMLFMTVALIALTVVVAFFMSKFTGIDFPTMMTSSIPGGMTQIITLAEEFKNIDMTLVTFFQVTRLMMIVFIVPLFVFSPLFGGQHAGSVDAASASAVWSDLFPHIWVYAPLCILCAWIGKKIKMPTAYMLGPMIGTSLLHLNGFSGPALPSSLLDLSQFMIGCYVGLLLKPDQLERKARTISLALAGGAILIAGAIGLSALLTRMHAVSQATAFLSMAPGGMDQMGIMAHEVGADLSVVSGYQTFRILFIYFVVSYALKALFRYTQSRKKPSHEQTVE